MKMKKVLALGLAVAMTATMFVGCGSKKDDSSSTTTNNDSKGGKQSVELKVWGPQEEQDLMKQLCEKFNEQEDEFDVKFTYAVVGENDAYTQISKDSKTAADVFMFGGDQLPAMTTGKYLFDLSALETELGVNLAEKFDSVALDSGKVDGKQYSLPFTPNITFLYYNKSMLTEEEVMSLDTIMAKNCGAGVKNFSVKLNDGFFNSAFFNANGCRVFGADGTDAASCDYNSKAGISVVKYLNNMIATGKFHLNADNDAITLLKNGKLASYMSGSWDASAVKEALKDNYAATILPTIKIDGADKSLKPFGSFKQIGVNASTKAPKAAAKLALFLTDKYAQEQRAKVRGYAPTNIELKDTQFEEVSITAQMLQATADHSVLQPTIDQMQKYWPVMEDLGNKIYKKDAAVKTDAAIQKTLNTVVETITAK